MSGFLSFFLNAIKAIFLSPVYLLIYLYGLIVAIFNFIIGLLRSIFSGFKYGSNGENRYQAKLNAIKISQNDGGNNNA